MGNMLPAHTATDVCTECVCEQRADNYVFVAVTFLLAHVRNTEDSVLLLRCV